MSGWSHEALRQALLPLLGPQGLLLGSDTASFEQGARYGQGRALGVVRPANVQQVQAVVQFCLHHRIALVPQGSNTGLVGASTPDASGSQLVLSTSRLRTVCDIDAANRSVTVDAGVTLHELNEQLDAHGLWFPIDLGANPTVGGMVATNTGGTRLIRYGDVRHNLLALQAVLLHADAPVLELGRALRKDNTGPDLKQLFVGTGGAGAIVTRATLEVHRKPQQSATALVVPTSDDAVLALLQGLECALGDYLSAFEGLSGNAMQAAIDHVPGLRNPFAPEPTPDFAILIELEAASSAAYTGLQLQDALNLFLQDQLEHTLSNAVIGNGPELWQLRHSISEGARALGTPIAFDVSVPRSHIMAFCRAARVLVAQEFAFLHVVEFGHIADGGVHFNVIWRRDAAQAYDPAVVARLRDRIYAMVVHDFAGSYSAEHGVGPHNMAYYQLYTPPEARRMAQGLRQLTDPLQLCGTVNFGPAVA